MDYARRVLSEAPARVISILSVLCGQTTFVFLFCMLLFFMELLQFCFRNILKCLKWAYNQHKKKTVKKEKEAIMAEAEEDVMPEAEEDIMTEDEDP